jgi:hypothetical protein
LPDAHWDQHGLHKAATPVVIIGISGEPKSQAKQGDNAGEKNQLGHGV